MVFSTKITILRGEPPCSLVHSHRRLVGTCCFHRHCVFRCVERRRRSPVRYLACANGGDWQVKCQVLAKPCPSSTLSAAVHTCIALASKPNLRAESGYLTTLTVAYIHTYQWMAGWLTSSELEWNGGGPVQIPEPQCYPTIRCPSRPAHL